MIKIKLDIFRSTNIILFICLSLLTEYSFSARIMSDVDYGFIIIKGEIKVGDDKRFQQELFLEWPEKKPNQIIINSPGGDLQTAMSIGREIRKRKLKIYLFEDSICASACVFVFAGGVDRDLSSQAKVIIHRPYIDSTLDNANYDSLYKSISLSIQTYLKEMNVSPDLWQLMASIPPHESVELTIAELKRYLLLGLDPGYEQQINSEEAKRLGISMATLHQRKRNVQRICNPLYALNQAETADEINFSLLGIIRTCKVELTNGRNPEMVINGIAQLVQKVADLETFSAKARMACIESVLTGSVFQE